MSNPSFSNIDRWLFELMEGNLSPEQIAQLESFLMQHPELDVDKDVWAQAKVDQQEFIYPHQDKFVRRRPVGLYSAIGFITIVLLTSLAVYINTNTDFMKDLEIARNQEKFENEKNAISESVNSSETSSVSLSSTASSEDSKSSTSRFSSSGLLVEELIVI